MKIRIVLADDHRMFREAMRVPLLGESDICIVAEAASGEAALAAVAASAPDVLVLDINLPDMSGIEVARQVSRRHPKTRIVMLSGYDERMFIEEALRAGARAYVVKSSGADELLTAIRATAAGKKFLCSEITDLMLHGVSAESSESSPPSSVLTPREREILTLLAQGQRSANIAAQLAITVATVEVHRRNLKDKLKLRTTAELTRYAIREGLLVA